jgi:hypothetical protein
MSEGMSDAQRTLAALWAEHVKDEFATRGIEALYRLRALVDLTRDTPVVGAVGSGYDDAVGLRPGRIAR